MDDTDVRTPILDISRVNVNLGPKHGGDSMGETDLDGGPHIDPTCEYLRNFISSNTGRFKFKT